MCKIDFSIPLGGDSDLDWEDSSDCVDLDPDVLTQISDTEF